MSKWLEKALAAVEADKAVSKLVLPNVINAKIAKIAKTPLVQRSEEDGSQQHPPETIFGNFDNFDSYGKRQNEFDWAGLPRYWKKAFDELAASPCPSYVTPERWQQLLADANQLSKWAPMLLAMGWILPDVLGRDHMSLLGMMQGQKLGAVTSTAVILRDTNGATTCVYRRGA